MYKLVILSFIQSTFLVAGQIFLKLALAKIDKMSFTWHCIKQLLANLQFLFCGLCMAAATFLWFYILRHFPFSAAYPLISISYVLGTLASVVVFHEEIPAVRYAGIALIILGVVLIAQK